MNRQLVPCRNPKACGVQHGHEPGTVCKAFLPGIQGTRTLPPPPPPQTVSLAAKAKAQVVREAEERSRTHAEVVLDDVQRAVKFSFGPNDLDIVDIAEQEGESTQAGYHVTLANSSGVSVKMYATRYLQHWPTTAPPTFTTMDGEPLSAIEAATMLEESSRARGYSTLSSNVGMAKAAHEAEQERRTLALREMKVQGALSKLFGPEHGITVQEMTGGLDDDTHSGLLAGHDGEPKLWIHAVAGATRITDLEGRNVAVLDAAEVLDGTLVVEPMEANWARLQAEKAEQEQREAARIQEETERANEEMRNRIFLLDADREQKRQERIQRRHLRKIRQSGAPWWMRPFVR